MLKKTIVIIPAYRGGNVIPNHLTKKLDGITLIQRAINTCKGFSDISNIIILSDIDDVGLIAKRNKVALLRWSEKNITASKILEYLKSNFNGIEDFLCFWPNSPLIESGELQEAYDMYQAENASALFTVKEENRATIEDIKFTTLTTDFLLGKKRKKCSVGSRTFLILRMDCFSQPWRNVVNYKLNEKSLEIATFQDWWICEKLLQRKKIVFVVAGYAAIGMGHIYRALMLAHEINNHEILFLCTRESELAVKQITSREYRTHLQKNDLIDDVLSLNPDLVINDILDTDVDYMRSLVERGVKIINFEDSGPGVEFADLVVNALYNSVKRGDENKWLFGKDYFCLRDEFIESTPREFGEFKILLITFGGTDDSDFTQKVLKTVYSLCKDKGIKIKIVTGPGYRYKERLQEYLGFLNDNNIEFLFSTNVMSSVMESVDVAISSNGRTIYELAHMKIPSIVMSHHDREGRHTFSRQENGFEYIGVMNPFDSEKLRVSFLRVLDNDYRLTMYGKMLSHNFGDNKKYMIEKILNHLN